VHGLKDLWKAHISAEAQHLFLVVPIANWNEAGAARERPFDLVAGRPLHSEVQHHLESGNRTPCAAPAQPPRLERIQQVGVRTPSVTNPRSAMSTSVI